MLLSLARSASQFRIRLVEDEQNALPNRPGLRTDFASSVWNFCRWIAVVPPPETYLSGDKQGETSAVPRLLLASKNYVLVLVVSLGHLWSNSPRSIDQNVNVTPRLTVKNCKILTTLLFRNSQKRLSTKKSNQISPRSHVGILIYRTWSIASGPPGHREQRSSVWIR